METCGFYCHLCQQLGGEYKACISVVYWLGISETIQTICALIETKQHFQSGSVTALRWT